MSAPAPRLTGAALRRATEEEKLARFLALRDADDWRDAEECLGIGGELVRSLGSLVGYAMKGKSGRTTRDLLAVLDREDREAAGYGGLWDALWTYDPARGGVFRNYALDKIRWAMLDQVRGLDMIGKGTRREVQGTYRAAQRLEKKLGREATEAEAAAEAGVSVERYRKHRVWESRSCAQALTEPLERYLSAADGDPLGRLCAIEEALEELGGEDAEIADAAEEIAQAVEGVKAMFRYGTRAA